MKQIRAARGTAATVAGVALVAALASCQSEDGSVARDATQDPSVSTSPEVTRLDAVDFGEEPALRTPYKRLAQRAVADGVVAMVPSELPDGWEVLGAGYQPGERTWWRMEVEGPEGPVLLDQLSGTPEEVLAGPQDELDPQDDVDLDAWGTGSWQQYSFGGTAVLSYRLKDSTVVIQAGDVETASTLAKSLVPAEGRATAEE